MSRAAVVTGVTSGIGRTLLERLLERGWTVVGLARDPAKLERTKRETQALPGTFHAHAVDLSDRQARAGVLQRLAGELDSVDLVIHNAGECVYETLLTLPAARLSELFEVNLFAGLELVQALATKMVGGSHVVLVSSVTTRFLPNARFAAYAVTKTAVEGVASALRLELDPRGIRVTTVVPGLVDTPIYDKVAGFERALAKTREQVPHWLSAADVADAVLWAIDRPAHVLVSEIVLLPVGQGR